MTKLTSLFALLFVLFTVNASAQNPGNSLQFTNQTPPVVNKPGTTTSDPMLQQRYAQQAQQAMMAYMMDSISKALSHDIDAKVNAKVTAIVGAKLKKSEAQQKKIISGMRSELTSTRNDFAYKLKQNNQALVDMNASVDAKKADIEKTLTTFQETAKGIDKKLDSFNWKLYGTWGGVAILFIILILAGFKLNTRINLASTKYDANMNKLVADYNARHNPS